MIQVGIIGCGWAGQRHQKAVMNSTQAELLAIADKDEETLDQRRKEWNTKYAYRDYEEMLKLEDLDGVVVALPHDLHKEATVQSARAGKHILCEKPMAITLDEADAMIDAAQEKDVLLMIAEPNRYNTLTLKIEELLGEGVIGTAATAEQNWLHKFERYGYKDRPWLNDPRRAGGGQWIINGVHQISALRAWLKAAGAGEAQQIFAKEYRSPTFQTPRGIEATVNAFLTFEHGQTAKVTMAVEVEHHNRFNGVRIYGTEGTLTATGRPPLIELHRDKAAEPEIITLEEPAPSAFDIQMNHFVDCIESNAKPITNGIEERNTLAVIVAGYDSMKTGKATDVNIRK
ncbi:MAG: Gfo/Idh/MocA family protein [Candidatus Bathyarchaeia archaeon]